MSVQQKTQPTNESLDPEIEEAVKQSILTFQQEEAARIRLQSGLAEHGDLIDLDPEKQVQQRKITEITQLMGAMGSGNNRLSSSNSFSSLYPRLPNLYETPCSSSTLDYGGTVSTYFNDNHTRSDNIPRNSSSPCLARPSQTIPPVSTLSNPPAVDQMHTPLAARRSFGEPTRAQQQPPIVANTVRMRPVPGITLPYPNPSCGNFTILPVPPQLPNGRSGGVFIDPSTMIQSSDSINPAPGPLPIGFINPGAILTYNDRPSTMNIFNIPFANPNADLILFEEERDSGIEDFVGPGWLRDFDPLEQCVSDSVKNSDQIESANPSEQPRPAQLTKARASLSFMNPMALDLHKKDQIKKRTTVPVMESVFSTSRDSEMLHDGQLLDFDVLEIIDCQSVFQHQIDSLIIAVSNSISESDFTCWWSQVITTRQVSLCESESWSASTPSSVKLIINQPFSKEPFINAIDVTLEAQNLVAILLPEQEVASNYALKISGFDEYLIPNSTLLSQHYIQKCLKFDLEAEFDLVAVPSVDRTRESLLNCHFDTENNFFKRVMKKEKWIKLIDTLKGDVISAFTNMTTFTARARKTFFLTIREIVAACGHVMPDSLDKNVRLFIEQCEICSTEKMTNEKRIVQRLKKIAHKIVVDLHEMITVFCASTSAPFSLAPLVLPSRAAPIEEDLCTVSDSYEIEVISIHSIPDGWKGRFQRFELWSMLDEGNPSKFGQYNNHAISAKQFMSIPKATDDSSLCAASSSSLLFEKTIDYSKKICVLPIDARVMFVLYGFERDETVNDDDGRQAENAPRYRRRRLGSAVFYPFDCTKHLKYGHWIVALQSISGVERIEPWGQDMTILNDLTKSHNMLVRVGTGKRRIKYPVFDAQKQTGELLSVTEMADALSQIELYWLNRKNRNQRKVDLSSMEYSTSTLEQVDTLSLWSKRSSLVKSYPLALIPVLMSAPGWDVLQMPHIYGLIADTKSCDASIALQLLTPEFPNEKIREAALGILERSEYELTTFLPQLVEALRFETNENSSLAVFLLKHALKSWRFAHFLHWALFQRVQYKGAEAFGMRCNLLMGILHVLPIPQFGDSLIHQNSLCSLLENISTELKENCRELDVKKAHLNRSVEGINNDLLGSTDKHIRLPVNPAVCLDHIDQNSTKFYNSLTNPIALRCKTVSNEIRPHHARHSHQYTPKHGQCNYGVLYKNSQQRHTGRAKNTTLDDLRQDMVVMQMVYFMENIWRKSGLDLKVITFDCLPTGVGTGMIELVLDCMTKREINSEQGKSIMDRIDPCALLNWLRRNNPDEYQYERALINFRQSCAAWCVVTFVLGIGDRHSDNILITRRGLMCHIDFGKYLGDLQMVGNFKRDRVPFLLSTDMVLVINKGSKSDTEGMLDFVEDCCKAFNLIRHNQSIIISALNLLECSGVKGLDTNAAHFISQKLMLDKSDSYASFEFVGLICESASAVFSTFNNFVHDMVHRNDDKSDKTVQKLNAISEIYSMRQPNQPAGRNDDARISKIIIDGDKQFLPIKRYEPNKHYLFPVHVIRDGIAEPEKVYRSYRDYLELNCNLRAKFPLVKIPEMPQTFSVGRQEVHEVAELRKRVIEKFLNAVFELKPEVAHSSLIYTFFHPRREDSIEFEEALQSVNQAAPSIPNTITGSIKFSVSFDPSTSKLEVVVKNCRELYKNKADKEPKVLIKVFIRPSLPYGSSKQTTTAHSVGQFPFFYEPMEFTLNEHELSNRTLEISVHNSSRYSNSFLGGIQVGLNQLKGPRFEMQNRTVDLTNIVRLNDASANYA